MSTMSNTEIKFKQVSIEAIKSGNNFESAITQMVDGKELPAEEYTSIIFQKYTGYAPSEFPKPGKKGPGPKEMVPNPPEKRDYIKVKLDPSDPNAMELKNIIEKYDESYESNYNLIFDEETRKFFEKTNKKGEKINEFKFKPSIKEVERDDEEEPVEGAKPKPDDYFFDSCKLKLDMGWAYYYNDEKLDAHNTKIIMKAISDTKKALKGSVFDKSVIESIVVDLEFKDEDSGEMKKVSVKMSDIPSKKTHIKTVVFMRKPSEIVEGIKKPHECTEEELDKYYGEPKCLENCTSPEEFEKHYKNYSYVRFVIAPEKVRFWKMADKKECAINFVIRQIEIIREPFVSNVVKHNYKEYSFGKMHKSGLLIDQSIDNQYKESKETKVENKESKVKETVKADETKQTKKLDVDESGSGSESGSGESGSESGESGSESESESESGSESESDEPEPDVKTASKKVTKKVEEVKVDKSATTKKPPATKKK